MNPADPLANLAPLREPAAIGWWPLAPGWWLLAALLLCLLFAAFVLLLRHYRANAYRRQGLAQLAQLHARLQQDGDTLAFAAATNALLKSVALRVMPREQIAACSGRRWLALLNNSFPGRQCFQEDFTEALYKGDASALDAQQLHQCASRWIYKHRVPA